MFKYVAALKRIQPANKTAYQRVKLISNLILEIICCSRVTQLFFIACSYTDTGGRKKMELIKKEIEEEKENL